jgi:anti-sigma-K factor RskA
MTELVPPVPPPANLYGRIRSQIGLASHVTVLETREATWQRRARRWRGAAVAMGALAASLVGVIAWRETVRPDMPKTYVAVLQAGEASPAFLVTVDLKTNMCVIKAIAKPPKDDMSYEVWLVHDKLAKPKSLGTFVKDDMETMPMDGGMDRDMFMNATFAVSLEPMGGSPTGQPTGPVMYTGKLIQSTP